MKELRPRQAKTVSDLREAYKLGFRRIMVQGCTGFGKCLGRDTPVLMFDGRIVPVQDVRVGDKLIGPDSKPRTVQSVCTGREPLYEVAPRKGDPYVVNESHVLSLRISGSPKREIVNITVRDYLRRSIRWQDTAKGWRAGVDFQASSETLAVDPYFLGLWLGDGCSRTPAICTGDPEVHAAVCDYAASLGMRVREQENSPRSQVLHVVAAVRGRGNPLMTALRWYGVVQNKHIPHGYKTASREDRLALLAGLIDTDGHKIARGGYELTLKSERLFDDALFVARSLGFSAYKKAVTKTCGNNGAVGKYFRCSINGPVETIPCRIARKKSEPRRQKKDVLVTGIAVESIGEGDYFGFELSGDGLFLLGDFTVTHNTVIAAALIGNSRRKATPRRSHFWVPAVSLVDQTVRSLYDEGLRDIGVLQANHIMTDGSKPIQVVSVQTLEKRQIEPEMIPHVVFVDEAHLQFAIIRELIEKWVDTLFVGFSATPWSKGLGRYWQRLIVSATLQNMIDEGWAPPMRVFAPSKPDLSDVPVVTTTHGRDYQESGAAAAMQKGSLTADIVSTWLQRAKGRPTFAFCVDRQHAMALQQQFERAGVRAGYQDGGTSGVEREVLRKQFHRGEIEVICSVATMTVGIDYDVRCVIWARPTKSSMFYVQGIGRGERPLFAPDFDPLRATDAQRKAAIARGPKPDLLVLDHAGVTLELGFASDIHETKLDDGTPTKASANKPETRKPRECPKCTALFPKFARVCPECKFEPALQPREIDTLDGELVELDKQKRQKGMTPAEKRQFFAELKGAALQRGKNDKWVLAQFRAKTSEWPHTKYVQAIDPSPATLSWLRSRAIRWAKSKEREQQA